MTRQPVPYWHVDAFAERPFTGNQAAVMLLDKWPNDALLLAIAAENNFAETAFVVRETSGSADYALRWFTPTSEVDLCGHATLASGHVLLSRDGGTGGGTGVTFATRKAGLLEVRRTSDGDPRRARYELDLPVTLVEPADEPALLRALGAKGATFRSVSGSADTVIILLEDEAAVRALAPDMRALAATGLMAICTAPGDGVGSASGTGSGVASADIVSRVFVPAWGVNEDSVTGSAHAALTAFWAKRLGRERFSAHQASPRGGNLTCRLEGARAVLAGMCITMVEGRFFLPDQV